MSDNWLWWAFCDWIQNPYHNWIRDSAFGDHQHPQNDCAKGGTEYLAHDVMETLELETWQPQSSIFQGCFLWTHCPGFAFLHGHCDHHQLQMVHSALYIFYHHARSLHDNTQFLDLRNGRPPKLAEGNFNCPPSPLLATDMTSKDWLAACGKPSALDSVVLKACDKITTPRVTPVLGCLRRNKTMDIWNFESPNSDFETRKAAEICKLDPLPTRNAKKLYADNTGLGNPSTRNLFFRSLASLYHEQRFLPTLFPNLSIESNHASSVQIMLVCVARRRQGSLSTGTHGTVVPSRHCKNDNSGDNFKGTDVWFLDHSFAISIVLIDISMINYVLQHRVESGPIHTRGERQK